MLADALGNAVIGFFSLVLLGALGGHGKTTWAVNLLLHMAAGIDFAPFVVRRPVSILVIENEGQSSFSRTSWLRVSSPSRTS